jgi:hypothetical protein
MTEEKMNNLEEDVLSESTMEEPCSLDYCLGGERMYTDCVRCLVAIDMLYVYPGQKTSTLEEK